MKPRFALLGVLALSAALFLGCAPTDPQQVVNQLLTMRKQGVTDKKQYDKVVADPKVASQIANDSAARTTTVAPTPDWNRPELTTQTAKSAEVSVTWKVDPAHPGWPRRSVFVVTRTAAGWKVSGVSTASAQAVPKK